MPRLKTVDLHRVYQKTGKTLMTAGGADKVTSRQELKGVLSKLDGNEKDFTREFYNYVSNRSGKPRDGITHDDVKKAVAYAKNNLVSRFDQNLNGLSKDEVAKMTRLGKLAVSVAEDVEVGRATAKLAAKFAAASEGIVYISESDFPPRFVAGALPGGKMTREGMRQAIDEKVLAFFRKQNGSTVESGDLAWDFYSTRERESFLNGLTTPYDKSDASMVDYARGFKRLVKLAEKELTDLTVVHIGPRGPDGKIRESGGLYAFAILGKVKETGLLAGTMFGSVET